MLNLQLHHALPLMICSRESTQKLMSTSKNYPLVHVKLSLLPQPHVTSWTLNHHFRFGGDQISPNNWFEHPIIDQSVAIRFLGNVSTKVLAPWAPTPHLFLLDSTPPKVIAATAATARNGSRSTRALWMYKELQAWQAEELMQA